MDIIKGQKFGSSVEVEKKLFSYICFKQSHQKLLRRRRRNFHPCTAKTFKLREINLAVFYFPSRYSRSVQPCQYQLGMQREVAKHDRYAKVAQDDSSAL